MAAAVAECRSGWLHPGQSRARMLPPGDHHALAPLPSLLLRRCFSGELDPASWQWGVRERFSESLRLSSWSGTVLVDRQRSMGTVQSRPCLRARLSRWHLRSAQDAARARLGGGGCDHVARPGPTTRPAARRLVIQKRYVAASFCPAGAERCKLRRSSPGLLPSAELQISGSPVVSLIERGGNPPLPEASRLPSGYRISGRFGRQPPRRVHASGDERSASSRAAAPPPGLRRRHWPKRGACASVSAAGLSEPRFRAAGVDGGRGFEVPGHEFVNKHALARPVPEILRLRRPGAPDPTMHET